MVEERPVVEEPETLSQFWPDEDRPLAANDLLRQPDDGNRYELVDGVLQVTPAPPTGHQYVVTRLTMILGGWCPENLDVLSGPGINLADDLHRVPDLAVIRPVRLSEEFLTEPPVLAVEVASRSTQKVDRTRKNHEYAEFGIDAYWIVVPFQDRPSLTAFELHDGTYEQIATATGGQAFEAIRPFVVRIVPSLLVADGRAWRSMLP